MLANSSIFTIQNNEDFEHAVLKVFAYQAQHCDVYNQYIRLLDINPASITCVEQIPFLPIRFFKTKNIYAANKAADIVFTSSGTSGMDASKHAVADVNIYIQSFVNGFRHFYGNPQQYAILALLPAYLERQGSSLIYMVQHLIKQSNHPQSGFFLNNYNELLSTLQLLQNNGTPTLLIGVSFALLDFVEQFHINFPQLMVMETGGMKGRRRELPREELHELLCAGFGVTHIHSEYGMTELLSQAYSKGEGRFFTPPWMQILIRDAQNPLAPTTQGSVGGINVIDLANIYSCSFIETQDLGRLYPDNSFEIIGRFDDSDIRGCNLLIAE